MMGEVLLVFSEQKPGKWLDILQRTGLRPDTSVVCRCGGPGIRCYLRLKHPSFFLPPPFLLNLVT